MKILANAIKVGNILVIKNKLFSVLKLSHTQPGKGGAYIQAELKGLLDGTKQNIRFRSAETVERARLEKEAYQFLYSDTDFYFMNMETYEQIIISKDLLAEPCFQLLDSELEVAILFYDGTPIKVELPIKMSVEVVKADASLKSQTVTSSLKNASLKNDIKVLVPTFINAGDKIIIDTRDMSYIERDKS